MKKSAFNLRLSLPWLPPKILLIMKLIVVIMTTCLMQVSAAGFAQKITFSKKGATLEQIFSEIRKQTGYYVVYAENKVDKQAKLDVNFRNTELKSVLDVISNSQDLEYSFDERNISLKPKEQSFIDRVIARFQSIDVRGIIVDENNQRLGGASVRLKNGKTSVLTNELGEFYLQNVEEGGIITISYIGYSTKEIRASENLGIIKMDLSSSKLDEIQIQAYGKISKRLSTSNITTITADDIAKQPVDNPLLALVGRVPNLTVIPNSGMPGSAIQLQLRGQNSIGKVGTSGTKPSEPLIIIDGVPFINNIAGANNPGGSFGFNQNALSFINPNDIESINVLADADATAIYGSRGANGVILISTKKGDRSETRIDINFNRGFSNVAKKVDMLNTEQYLEMRREAFKNDGLPIPNHETAAKDRNARNYDLTLWDDNRYTDWQDEFLGGIASNLNGSGSISGGSSSVQFLLSGNYSSEGYVFPGKAHWNKGNGHFSITGTTPNRKFRATLNGTYNIHKSISPADLTNLAITLAPNAPSINSGGGELNWELDPSSGRASWTNPFSLLTLSNEQKTNTIVAGTDLSYQLLTGLTVKAALTFSDLTLNSFSIRRSMASIEPAQRSILTGTTSRNNNRFQSWSIEPQVNYNKYIWLGKLESVFGFSVQGNNSSIEYLEARGYKNDALLNNLASASSFLPRNTSSQYKYAGAFGRLNYNLFDKYIFNFSGRRDGSSRFGPGRQFGNFWSTGAAWIFSEEKRLKNFSKFLSFGKIRGSYGTNGSDGISDNGFLETYLIDAILQDNNVQYQGSGSFLVSSGTNNSDYSWESVTKAEIGLELGFLKDRFLLNTSLWRTRCDNQLGDFPLPATGGTLSIIANRDAKIENRGLEFSLSVYNIKSDTFSWNTNVNFGLRRNRLLALPEDFGLNSNPYVFRNDNAIGRPFSGILGVYEYRGTNPETGVYQFSDINGDVTEDQSAAYPYAKIINIDPKFSGGISNTFTLKGFSVDFFLQFKKQLGRNYLYQDISGYPGTFSALDGVGNRPVGVMQRWKQTGDQSEIQKFSTSLSNDVVIASSNAANSDLAWTDASFLRLKNLSMSYSFSSKVLSKVKIAKLKVFANAQNLFTLTKYKGSDPETQSILVLPPLRTYVFGIQLGL